MSSRYERFREGRTRFAAMNVLSGLLLFAETVYGIVFVWRGIDV
jgi:hypothetical protein